eukprot:246999-Amphidinium_carterae.1
MSAMRSLSPVLSNLSNIWRACLSRSQSNSLPSWESYSLSDVQGVLASSKSSEACKAVSVCANAAVHGVTPADKAGSLVPSRIAHAIGTDLTRTK